MTVVLEFAGYAIYAGLAASALYGVFCVVLLARRIAQKRFSGRNASKQFLDDVRAKLKNKDFDGINEMCDSPPLWSKAVPQLILVALRHRHRPVKKIRQILAEQFEREILADLEYRTSWVATIVKSAPMLGLLGTVTGMINAFAKIANMEQTGGSPGDLAGEISFALFTTAAGLAVAIPLVLAGAMIHVRIGKLQDAVQEDLGEFLDSFEPVVASGGK